MAAVAALGCVVCRIHFGVFSPAAIHHTDGKTKPGAHMRVLPLCGAHHQTGGYGMAYHSGSRAFESNFGSIAELLAWVAAQLSGETPPKTPPT